MESRSFPAALHGAAFVSSEGKVYRLFAEDESPSLGESLQFNRFEYESAIEQLDDFRAVPPFPMTIRFSPDSAETVMNVDERIGNTLNCPSPSTLSLNEAIRRLRAVEGLWRRRSEEPSVQLFDSMSQSATDKSKRVFSKTQPSISEVGRTEEKPQRPVVRQSKIDFQPTTKPFEEEFDVRGLGLECEKNSNSGFLPLEYRIPDTDSQPTDHEPRPTIHLLRVIMRAPQRSVRFVPQRKTGACRQRGRTERPESIVAETVEQIDNGEVVSMLKFETTDTSELIFGEDNSIVVKEPMLEKVVEETLAPHPNVNQDAEERDEPIKPRCVSFRWPSVCDALKEKADRQIRSLADHLIVLKENIRQTICFHGFFPSEGCSTLLLCAVRELTDRGFNVLLVDGNTRNPELPKLLGIPTAWALGERLALVDHRLELLSLYGTTGKMNSTLTQVRLLKHSYDFILIDAGSLTEGDPSEKTLFWQETAADGVFLVVNTKNRQPVNLDAVGSRLRRHGVELLGVSENYV